MKKKQTSRSSPYQRAKKTVKLTTAALSIGALIGAAIGLLSAPKSGKEFRTDLEREGGRLWKQLKKSKKEINAIVKKAFGEVSPETLELYTKAKSEVLARVAKYKDTLTKKQYDEIVDSVMKRLSKSKKYRKSLVILTKEFKRTWKELKEIL